MGKADSKEKSRASLRSRLTELLGQAGAAWLADDAPRLGAALSFYALFALAPLLLIAVSTAGILFGQKAAQGRVVEQLHGLLGATAAAEIQEVMRRIDQPALGTLATIFAFAAMLAGASGVFVELQDALNTIWKLDKSPRPFWEAAIRQRLWSLGIIATTGIVLIALSLVTTLLSAAETFASSLSRAPKVFLEAANLLSSFGVVTLLVALILKIVPDTPIRWRDVWFGAAVTSLLFTIGKSAMGWYFGYSLLNSPYGAAASLVIFMVWIYYSSQLFLFGAELAHVWALSRGSRAEFNSSADGER